MIEKYDLKTTRIPVQNMVTVLAVSTAHNNTFVMVRVDIPQQQESIVHCDAKGQILWEVNYHSKIETFGQINEKQVIVMNVPANRIEILNLERKDVREGRHNYYGRDAGQMKIYNFAQTGIFCIQEQTQFLKLTYYQSIEDQTINLLSEYYSTIYEWNPSQQIFKGNNHSKIIWPKSKQSQIVSFNYFDLLDDPRGRLNTVTSINTVGSIYRMNGLHVNILEIWESRRNQYMFYGLSNKKEHNALSKCGKYKNTYIVDATHGNNQAVLRQTKFTLQIAQDGFDYNDKLVHNFGIGQISVLHTVSRLQNGVAIPTPIYYFNNETEEIVAQETWLTSSKDEPFYLPGWAQNTFIFAEHRFMENEQIVVHQKRFVVPPEVQYLHLLLGINQDFDEDLLKDALDLLQKQ